MVQRLRSAIHFDCENLGEEDLQLWTRIKFLAGDHSCVAVCMYPNTYSLVICYIAMENGPVGSLIYQNKSDVLQ